MSFSHRSWAAALLLAAQGLVGMHTAAASASSSAAIERGKYLALAGNCAACHTAPDGAAFAGGLAFETAFGTIYSTNITPDPETGIGKWTGEQFLQALRQGVRPDGEHLYPVFPYTSFTKITDADGAALFAYLKSLPAVGSKPPENDMSFPYNQRWLMSVWKAMFFTEGAYQADPKKSAAVESRRLSRRRPWSLFGMPLPAQLPGRREHRCRVHRWRVQRQDSGWRDSPVVGSQPHRCA